MSKRNLTEINAEYAKEALIGGDFIAKFVMANKEWCLRLFKLKEESEEAAEEERENRRIIAEYKAQSVPAIEQETAKAIE